MDVRRINQILGPLMLLIWAILWMLYWLLGRTLELGVLFLAIGVVVSIAIIVIRNYLWRNYPVELLGLGEGEPRTQEQRS